MNPCIPHQKKGWHQNEMFRLNACPSYKILLRSYYTLLSATYSARYTVPQMKNSRRSASATIQSPRKYDNLHAPNYQLLPQKCSSHYASVSAIYTQCYKRRTMLESSLLSIQSPKKIPTTVYKCTVGKPCIALPRIDTLGCQQIRNGTQRRTKVSP